MKNVAIPDDLRSLLDELVTDHSPDEILLFGSRAKGLARPDSDWDLLVLVPVAEERAVPEHIVPARSESVIVSGTTGFYASRHVANTLGREVSGHAVVLYRREGWSPPDVVDDAAAAMLTALHLGRCRDNLDAAALLSGVPYGRSRQLRLAAGEMLVAYATVADVHLGRDERRSVAALSRRLPGAGLSSHLAGLELLDRLEEMDISDVADWAALLPEDDARLLDALAEGLERALEAARRGL